MRDKVGDKVKDKVGDKVQDKVGDTARDKWETLLPPFSLSSSLSPTLSPSVSRCTLLSHFVSDLSPACLPH